VQTRVCGAAWVLCTRNYNNHLSAATTLFPATMSFSSRKETHNSYPPSSSSSRTSMNGVLHHRSSKATIQSHQESISNFSVHTSTAAIYKDLDNPSEQGPHPSSRTIFRSHPVVALPLLLITNLLTLSRNRVLVSEINLCLLYVPPTTPNPTILLLQLLH
jgi:hypothetical protein